MSMTIEPTIDLLLTDTKYITYLILFYSNNGKWINKMIIQIENSNNPFKISLTLIFKIPRNICLCLLQVDKKEKKKANKCNRIV